jgi:pantothenate synthetase
MNNRDLALDVEITAVEIERDAKYLACAPRPLLRKSRAELEAAREYLNDAIARLDQLEAA